MKVVLGLDVGVASIGWAIISENGEKSEILASGVRIIPLDQSDDFRKGKSVSLNAKRRAYRSIRRNYQRQQLKKEKLKQILSKNGMYPNTALIELERETLFQLRANAASQRISLRELGRVMLMLSQKRGFKSNRKTDIEEGELTAFKQVLADNSNLLTEKKQTVGEYLNQLIQENPHNRSKGSENTRFNRKEYIEEFDKIWNTQAQFHPELTKELKSEIGKRTLFYQRPLQSQKGLISKCFFEKNSRVAPTSSPFYQQFRYWQRINDLRVFDDEGQAFELSQNQKTLLAAALDDAEKLTKTKILKLLNYTPTRKYSLNFDEIKGNTTKGKLLKKFDKIGYDTIDILDFDLDEGINSHAYQLWHLLYATIESDQIVKTLIQKYGFEEVQAEQLLKTTFEQEYASVSVKAIKKILPHLKKGFDFSQACELAGYNHSNYQTKEENESRILKDEIPIIKKNELRNPVVEKIVNQVIVLVNTIINDDQLKRPEEVRVELARELKQNKKQRESADKSMREAEKRNKKIRATLQAAPFNLKYPSRNDVTKYRLWEETGRTSIYTGKPIKCSDLFDQSKYEIEHIIPKSRLYNDSYGNKTLSESDFNKKKDASTAYDYIQTLGESQLSSYLLRVEDNTKMSFGKKQLLRMSAADIPEDFIQRHLRDSQYIAKEVVNRIATVCRNVMTTSGTITDYLRHQWGLTDMLKDLNKERYEKEKGRITTFTDHNGNQRYHIKDWSKRDDHRHHAVDALIVACTKQGIVTRLNTLNQQFATNQALKTSGTKFKLPWANFRQDAKKSIEQILVSRNARNRIATKSKNRYKNSRSKKQITQEILTPRGFLHKETVYGKIKRYAAEKTPLNAKFTKEKALLIINKEIQAAVLQHLKKHEGNFKIAFNKKHKSTLKINDKVIENVRLWEYITTQKVAVRSFFDLTAAKKKTWSAEFDKKLEQVLDGRVRRVLQERINQKGVDAFTNLDENPILIEVPRKDRSDKIKRDKTEKQILSSITINARLDIVTPIRENYKGEPIDYVNLRNNHHVTFHKNSKGEIYEKEIVSFWTAFERIKAAFPVFNTTPDKEGDAYVYSFVKADLVLDNSELSLSKEAILNPINHAIISPYVYRVQKFSTKDLWFRHHLATTINGKNNVIRIRKASALKNIVKLKIDRLGRIFDVIFT